MTQADSSPRPVAATTMRLANPGLVMALLATWIVAPLALRADPETELAQLNEVRFWSAGDVTRVALETSLEVQFKYDRLKSPDRVYVDLYDTVPKGAKGMKTIAVGDGVIKRIRTSLSQKNVTRVVLDLEAEVEVSTSQLSNPDRVMIELRRPAEVPAARPAASPSAEGRASKERPEAKTDAKAPVKAGREGKPSQEPALTTEHSAAGTARVNGGSAGRAGPVRAFVAPASATPVVETPFVLAQAGKLPAIPAVSVQRMRVSRILEPAPVLLARPPASAPETSTALAEVGRPRAEAASESSISTAASVPAEVRIANPAKRDKTGNRSLTRVLGLKLGRVVLDAGHGGHDTGTITKSGLVEKELVLDVALRLGKLIEERLAAEVIYTRADDTFIPLEKRAVIANQKQADLFLSIHANSSPFKTTVGTETFYLNFTSSKADMEVAARENAGAEKSIHELTDLLRKIALKDKKDESREFADKIQQASYDFSTRTHGKIRNRGVKTAPFIVLIGAQMPGVLTEIGFMSNSKEEGLLKKPEHRQKIAESLFKGIESYTESLSNFRVAQRQ